MLIVHFCETKLHKPISGYHDNVIVHCMMPVMTSRMTAAMSVDVLGTNPAGITAVTNLVGRGNYLYCD